jgi:hypothetical protein
VAVAIALLAVGAVEAGAAGRRRPARGAASAREQVTARGARTAAIAPSIGVVDVFSGHPRWHLTLAAARDAAVEQARRDHGPSAFAWPVSVSRSGKSIIFESIGHGGRRDRYLVRLTPTRNRVAVQRGALPPQGSGP